MPLSNTHSFVHSSFHAVNTHWLYERHWVRHCGQQEKDRRSSPSWNLQPGEETYTVFCLKRDSESGPLLGKAGGHVGPHRTFRAARRQNPERLWGQGKGKGSKRHKRKMKTNLAYFIWRQASHQAVRFQFFFCLMSEAESADKCLSLNHPPATGSSNYSELPHPGWCSCKHQ